MTAATKRLLVSLFLLSLLSGHTSASEPTPFPEPVRETRPAVDGVNGKLSFAKTIDGPEVQSISGALSMPIGNQFGLQIDGKAAEVDTDIVGDIPVYAAAAHAFWRDPTKGMLGLYAGYSHIDILQGLSFGVLGIESALYIGRFSIDVLAGGIDGDIVDASFFDVAQLSYYPTDDLRLQVGHSYAFGSHSLIYGLEWSLGGHAGTAAALYASGSMTQDGTHAAGLGLRFYFGQSDKTLIRRHREDDPATTPHTKLPCDEVIVVHNGNQNTIIFGQASGPGCGGSSIPW